MRQWKRNKKPCPNCQSEKLWRVHINSSRLPWWWYVECSECHWCGATKLFLFRAKRAWNKEVRE